MTELCTNMNCTLKLDCAFFQTATDFKGSDFTDIKECNGKKFVKFKKK